MLPMHRTDRSQCYPRLRQFCRSLQPRSLGAVDAKRTDLTEQGTRPPTCQPFTGCLMLKPTKNLILPTTLVGSYPRTLWANDSLRGRSYNHAIVDSLLREQYLDIVTGI